MKPIEPMLAELAPGPFDSPRHIFEPKLDGVRCLAHIENGQVRLQARSGTDITEQYPELHDLPGLVKASQAVLDGEIVCYNEKGIPEFNRIQNRIHKRGPAVEWARKQFPARYIVFDILQVVGQDMTVKGSPLTLMERKAVLMRVLGGPFPSVERILWMDEPLVSGIRAFETMREMGMEGIMAKDVDSLYYPGKRHPAWKKVKAHLDDSFIIGGFTKGKGWREGLLGALIVGKPTGNGKLRWVAEVGSGLKDRVLTDLAAALPRLETDECPFKDYAGGNDVAMWVRPLLVVDVKYLEVTRDGHLRWPIFLRVRTDMKAEEVNNER